MTTLYAITTLNKALAYLKQDSTLADALRTALNILREERRRELAGQRPPRSQDPGALSSYPLTIVKDRYGGCYSHGVYTAWNLEPEEVPCEISSDDLSCGDFWDDNILPVGLGNTPDEAEQDLLKKIAE